MYTIGEFAKLTQLTVRTLHYYEEMELIIPASVDANTGYRYYQDNQIEIINVVKILKDVGFSLRDVKSILFNQADINNLKEQLLLRRERAMAEIAEAKYRYNLIINILNNFDETQNDLMEVLKMNVKENITLTNEKSFFENANLIVRESLRQDKDVCGLIIDIDQFKKVNDNFGFTIGDEVIKQIKNSLSSIQINELKEFGTDYLCMERNGGDEFRIILKDNIEKAKKLGKLIVESISAIDYKAYVDNLQSTVTVGVCDAKCAGSDGAARLFEYATAAMYEGKMDGGNCYKVYKNK